MTAPRERSQRQAAERQAKFEEYFRSLNLDEASFLIFQRNI